jgi:hypothetical protein
VVHRAAVDSEDIPSQEQHVPAMRWERPGTCRARRWCSGNDRCSAESVGCPQGFTQEEM